MAADLAVPNHKVLSYIRELVVNIFPERFRLENKVLFEWVCNKTLVADHRGSTQEGPNLQHFSLIGV